MTRTTTRRLAGATTVGLAALLMASACSTTSTGSPSVSQTSSSAASSAVTPSSQAPTSASSAESSTVASVSTSGSAGSVSSASGPTTKLPSASLTLLFGTSGPAETAALNAAAKAWGTTSGSSVTVTPAQNLDQQLAQGFSSNSAPDVFYVGAGEFPNFAKAGDLLPYADSMANASDYYPALKASFSYQGKFYCAPKDFSTLALFINTDMWTKAGLTDADIPKNWDQLESDAKKLTSGKVPGLVMSPEHDRLDAFMVQNGGYLVDSNNKATVNDPKNVAALTYVKKLYTEGALKWYKDLGAGWAGEAFGKGEAAMTIEGNWLLGSMKSDYPNEKYKVVELPAGPTGTKGTLSFTNCWGIAATTKHPDQAKALVAYLTSDAQQLQFSQAFGVLPSVQSAQAAYLKQFPANAPFVAGVTYSKGVVTAPGIQAVLDDFNTQLQTLANADPKSILDSVQDNLSSALSS